ncbi:M56 family metallopeptidase [Shewanella submarina]|uniref:M56 family metallopeptidase n=1 Tax=Shewanella submarina TaxID=2016376 RepID=A0ABV7GI62_9GAMM|nr:M56 family metallopeptidase [Shewanella submarina]MCL1038697.1 M56 family metallopeptidase [Shewanella submarina]
MDYIITNTVISLTVLGCLVWLKDAPARVGFYLLMSALLSWFVPWQLIPSITIFPPVDSSALTIELFNISNPMTVLENRQSHPQTPGVTADNISYFTVWNALFLVTAIGAMLFAFRLFHYFTLLSRLHRNSSECEQMTAASSQYPIRVSRLATPAIATGLFKPTIWVDSAMSQRQELGSVLLHETTHIKHGDIFWVWIICLTESLFWWNPLCRVLARKARQQLEISCDEHCFDVLSDRYQHDLASLLLSPCTSSSTGAGHGGPVLNITHSQNFNVQRIKLLNKEKVMKSTHIGMILMALSASAVVAAAQLTEDGHAVTPAAGQSTDNHATANYESQFDELLKMSAGAKSHDAEELAQVASGVMSWQQGRTRLSGSEENMMNINSFTIFSHVLHKAGRYQEVLDAYEVWFPEGTSVPLFLNNVKAITYLKLQQPEFAAKEMEALGNGLGERVHGGSLRMLARAYIDMGEFEKALATLAHPNAIKDAQTNASAELQHNLLKYFIYTQQRDTEQAELVKAELPEKYAHNTAALPELGIPGSPLLKKI